MIGSASEIAGWILLVDCAFLGVEDIRGTKRKPDLFHLHPVNAKFYRIQVTSWNSGLQPVFARLICGLW